MSSTHMLFLLALLSAAVGAAFGEQLPRIDRLIDNDWKFTRSNPVGASALDYDDSRWEVVTIPHTWNALDGQDGGNDYYRGTGWYRKVILIDDSLSAKSIFLRFDAASLVATVFVNGTEVGTHRGGFGAFCFDISSRVKFGKPNLIAVIVNNARNEDVTPLRGDFTVFGGIYRSVHLLIMNRVSISPVDHASPGVYLSQKGVSRDSAAIDATVVVMNGEPQTQNILIQCSVRDRNGKEVTRTSSTVAIEGSMSTKVQEHCSIKNPHLWDGRTDPYLYTCIVEVSREGLLVDRVEQPFGVRFFNVDPERGFFLNGKSYPLHGVNRHQDRVNMGWAITPKEHKEDYALIEELGCTVVRLCHYQHAPVFYDLCDRGGMVVWAELALVDEVTESARFVDNCRDQLADLILQNYNHPSIFFWSMENELIPDHNPAFYGRVVQELAGLAKQLDPSRLTTVASRGNYDGAALINTATDIIGYNVYKGWYEGMPEELAGYVDDMHRRFPLKPMAISEYGAGAGTTQHELPLMKPLHSSDWHPEEWQAFVHETLWKVMASRNFIWGTFVWNMFDFASDGRAEGEQPGRNDKGLVTYDRKIKKDAFYFYKSNWNPEPMVYITSKRYEPRPAGATAFKIYSNCPTVELSMDGKSLGIQKGDGAVFVWEVTTIPPGRHTFTARGMGRGAEIIDQCTWTFQSPHQ